jgi:hypothetical protein
MGSLGSVYVDLSANTAKFTEGLSKAAYTAQQAGKSISREFSSLQRIASQTFSPFASFSPVASQFSFAISSMARAAVSASKEFGNLKTTSGALISIGAGATAALGSVAIGAIAVATRAAESAAKLDELSQSTGVSTEALSGLGFIARQNGVDTEIMVKGLERMSKSAFAAATAPAAAVNAYTRLGVSVKDSSGQMRTAEAIFTDIANRFVQMADGPAKTALAMQIFGRSGADLIPILDEGGSAIDELMQKARSLGIVISGETAESAEKFKQTMDLMNEAATGASNQLMTQLLPALQAVANALTKTDPGEQSSLSFIIDAVANITKELFVMVDIVASAFTEVAAILVDGTRQVVDVLEGLWMAAAEAMIGNFSGAVGELKQHFGDAAKAGDDFLSYSKKNWSDFQDFVNHLDFHPNFTIEGGFTAAEAFFKRLGPKGSVTADAKTKGLPVAATQKDSVADMIAKLGAEAAAQDSLASATDRSTAAMILQKAAAEATEKISEERTRLLDEETRLEEQLKNATSEGRAPEAAGLKKQIAAVKGYLQELETDTPLIESLFTKIAAGKFADSASDEVQKFLDKTEESIANAQALTRAYGQGPQAVANIQERAKISPFLEQLDDLKQLKDSGAITAQEYGVLASQIDKAIASVHGLSLAEASEAAAKFGEETGLQVSALDRLSAAAFSSAAALRAVETENKVQQFAAANPNVSADDIAKVRAEYQALDAAQHASELATRAAQLDASLGYQREMEELRQIAEIYGQNKDVALAVGAAEYDANRKVIEQWDEMVLKAGTFGEKMHTVLDQIALDAQNAGAKIAESIGRALNSFEDEIAKFVVTGKGSFRQIGEALAESTIKTGLQSLAGGVERKLGIKVPGGPKPSGTSTDPLYVSIVSGMAGHTVGSTSLIGSLFNGLGGFGSGTTPPFLPGPAASPATGILGKITGIFGGAAGAVANAGKNPDGTSGNPYYVIQKGGSSGSGGGLGDLLGGGDTSGDSGGGGGFGDIFGGGSGGDSGGGLIGGSSSSGGGFLSGLTGIFSKIGGGFSSIFSSLGGLASSAGSGIMSMFSGLGGLASSAGGGIMSALGSIGGFFGGFLAGGGDVTPGKAYVVGEKHPEFFVPRTAGTVHPTLQTGGGYRQSNVTVNVNGAKDFDSFRKSQTQIVSEMHAQLAHANSRN